MPGLDAPSHWVIIAVVVLVLFGYKKLPEMSRSLGRSLRIFKTEMKGLSEDDNARDADAASTVAAPTPPPVAPVSAPPVPAAPVPAVAVPAAPVAESGAAPAPVYPTPNGHPSTPSAGSQQLGA